MRSFDQFLAVLNEIPDPHRAEGTHFSNPSSTVLSRK